MPEEPERTTRARRAAELALVRVCHHYGGTPNFVLLGGLVPQLLCADSGMVHAGTTDVDVQVDLEIAAGADNAPRLETALRNADFSPDSGQVWRWETVQGGTYRAVIKFELLADLDSARQGDNVLFTSTSALGAVNLRGTGYAARDHTVRTLVAYDQGARRVADVHVTGLAGFLLAKTAAATGDTRPRTTTTSPSCCCTTTRSTSSARAQRNRPPRWCYAARSARRAANGARGSTRQLRRRRRLRDDRVRRPARAQPPRDRCGHRRDRRAAGGRGVCRCNPRGHCPARRIALYGIADRGPNTGPRRLESRVLCNDPTTNDKGRQDPSLRP